ncbi:MAG: hypothetical protein C7B43_05360 [Sulfobacillus benefaciens]|uniref:PepSY domain-containing protein n=1 Tax=Sulfobacillus benefaciens TaxID=453960 RepID=A0A2T2X7S5_9FIRM|nr:MAG: hypothetical protein C7B43_05360 [Sulfobacillus benefaciens]
MKRKKERFLWRTILATGMVLAMGWPVQVMAQRTSSTARISESRIVIRADSAATYAVQGGHVVRLVPSTSGRGRTLFTIDVQKGSHLFRVVVDPVTDEVLDVAKIH